MARRFMRRRKWRISSSTVSFHQFCRTLPFGFAQNHRSLVLSLPARNLSGFWPHLFIALHSALIVEFPEAASQVSCEEQLGVNALAII